MKTIRTHLATLLALMVFVSFGQTEYPEQDTDYTSSLQEDYRGDGFVTYSFYLENIGSEPLIFYNFKVNPDNDRYEFLKAYPDDILILYPHQKTSYVQVKVYADGPTLTWNSKYMRVKDESTTFPAQNRDYVYYWKSAAKADGLITYSYHLKNISSKNIRFYEFALSDNGGIYYMKDKLLIDEVVTAPGESIQLVKYDFKSGETPSANWYADWSNHVQTSDAFCIGLIRILDAAKEEGFGTAKGAIKRATNNSDTFFDQYYCKEHIDGLNDEVIEDLLFFIQYKGTVGSPAPLEVINKRFYEYKARMETCLPNFPERVSDENLNGLLKVEYEAEVDYEMHYLRLEVAFDPETSNHKLELVVEEVY